MPPWKEELPKPQAGSIPAHKSSDTSGQEMQTLLPPGDAASCCPPCCELRTLKLSSHLPQDPRKVMLCERPLS